MTLFFKIEDESNLKFNFSTHFEIICAITDMFSSSTLYSSIFNDLSIHDLTLYTCEMSNKHFSILKLKEILPQK